MPKLFLASAKPSANGIVIVKIRPNPRHPSTNADLVPAALDAINALNLSGGRGIHFDGPASLPVAMSIAHLVSHKFGYVAIRDPKLRAFVVAISHDPEYFPGDLITRSVNKRPLLR